MGEGGGGFGSEALGGVAGRAIGEAEGFLYVCGGAGFVESGFVRCDRYIRSNTRSLFERVGSRDWFRTATSDDVVEVHKLCPPGPPV